ncbi:MAG: GNAT family N-acetyltransferase [Pseudomonadota bacterium]
MPDQISYTQASDADLAHLPAIEAAAAQRFPRHLVPDPDATLSTEAFREALEAGLLLVASSAKTPVGFSVSRRIEGYLHLEEVSVHPSYGRRGIGRRLVEMVIETARGEQLDGVTLTTFASIPWNAPFYRGLGFSADNPPQFLQKILETERLSMDDRVALVLRGC